MEFQNFIIFRDWFTLNFKDKNIESLYKKQKYSFWRMMSTLVCYFICFIVVLSIELWMMYNDKTKDVNVNDLVFNALMAGFCLIFMLLLAFWKTKYWIFNMFCSLFMNFTQFIVFESIKIVSFISNQNKSGAFAITIVEFCIKCVWLFCVDDNFVYNLICYLAFLPLYLAVFVQMYEKQDNEIGFYIIIFTFLAIGIYFIERIFKINFFGNATYDEEILRNRNLVDNMKSAFVMFNLDNSKVTFNKIMKNKFIPKLLTGTNCPDQNLSIFKKDDNENLEENNNEKEILKDKEEINQKNDNLKDLTNQVIPLNIDDTTNENLKQCNIIKNILFTRLERVNAHDFEGELKKSSDEINQKIHAFTTKSTKYIFFNAKSNKVSNKKSNDKDDDGENSKLEKSEMGKSEVPIIKESDFKLLYDNDFENLIGILLNSESLLKEFKYLGTKRIKQEHDEDFICQIFVRYHNHGRNLEFVICESNSRKGQITSESLAKGLLSQQKGFEAIPNKSFLKQGKVTTAFLNKANTSIKHPLKEISVKMKEALEMLENPEENLNDIREILFYADNLAGLANYALEDLKYMNKPGKKKINLEKEKIDLPQLLENVIDLSKAKLKFKNKDIKLTYDIGQNVDDAIITDGKKLTHVLLNLIANSINSSSFGNIHILVESKSKRRDMLLFTILDQGMTMKKEQREFYNKTITEDFEKITGIVICKQIIEAIGRELKFEANNNQGTKASFSVKIHEDEVLNEDPQMTTDLSEEEDIVDSNIELGKIDAMENNMTKNLNINSVSNISTKKGDQIQSIKRFSHAVGHEIIDNCDLRIIFADDDPVLRSTFRKHIETFASSSKLKFDIIECKDGADLLYSLYTNFEENKYVDALLFDENMNFITGAVLVEIISILFKRSIIPDISVFMATEYEMNPSQYKFLKHLQKPIEYTSIKRYFSALIETPK